MKTVTPVKRFSDAKVYWAFQTEGFTVPLAASERELLSILEGVEGVSVQGSRVSVTECSQWLDMDKPGGLIQSGPGEYRLAIVLMLLAKHLPIAVTNAQLRNEVIADWKDLKKAFNYLSFQGYIDGKPDVDAFDDFAANVGLAPKKTERFKNTFF